MKNGDFIKIEFEGRIQLTGDIFDTTSSESAKEGNIYNPGFHYAPVLVVLGEKMVVPGVEKRLLDMNVGEEKKFVLKPEEGFGRRDHKLIQIISMKKFIKEKINPAPGMFVTIDHRRAKVQSVSGGRVRVDFNHPLAGKELSYKVKIIKQITATEEKLSSIVEYYGLKAETGIKEGVITLKTEKPLDKIIQKILGDKMKSLITEVKEVKFATKPSNNST